MARTGENKAIAAAGWHTTTGWSDDLILWSMWASHCVPRRRPPPLLCCHWPGKAAGKPNWEQSRLIIIIIQRFTDPGENQWPEKGSGGGKSRRRWFGHNGQTTEVQKTNFNFRGLKSSNEARQQSVMGSHTLGSQPSVALSGWCMEIGVISTRGDEGGRSVIIII